MWIKDLFGTIFRGNDRGEKLPEIKPHLSETYELLTTCFHEKQRIPNFHDFNKQLKWNKTLLVKKLREENLPNLLETWSVYQIDFWVRNLKSLPYLDLI